VDLNTEERFKKHAREGKKARRFFIQEQERRASKMIFFLCSKLDDVRKDDDGKKLDIPVDAAFDFFFVVL